MIDKNKDSLSYFVEDTDKLTILVTNATEGDLGYVKLLAETYRQQEDSLTSTHSFFLMADHVART